jgi:hypothetical protein
MSAQHSPITAVFPPPHLISTFDGVDIDRVRARQNKARIAVVLEHRRSDQDERRWIVILVLQRSSSFS